MLHFELIVERDRLVSALRERGVDYLAPEDAAGEPVSDEVLIASLAASEDPRLRAALTGLFLLRSESASSLPAAMAWLGADTRDELTARYMAAVYLQRLWWTTLGLYLGEMAELPDLYSGLINLPPATEEHGKPGLYALAEWHMARAPGAYNRLAEYQIVMGHLFALLQRQAPAHESTTPG